MTKCLGGVILRFGNSLRELICCTLNGALTRYVRRGLRDKEVSIAYTSKKDFYIGRYIKSMGRT